MGLVLGFPRLESKVKGHTWLLAALFVAGSSRAREHVQTPFTVMQ